MNSFSECPSSEPRHERPLQMSISYPDLAIEAGVGVLIDLEVIIIRPSKCQPRRRQRESADDEAIDEKTE